jgi:hypothetical protein
MRPATIHPFCLRGLRTTVLACMMATLGLLVSAVEAAPKKAVKSKFKTGKIPLPEMHRDSMRFLNAEEQILFVQKMAAAVSISKRPLDPFCRPQDPDAPPIMPSVGIKSKGASASIQSMPFSDVIQRIKINTIHPKDRIFLIGEREYREGGQITLTYRMRKIKADIVSIRSSSIVFRDPESKETATLSMNLLPAGMQGGHQGFQAPGLQRLDPNAPIQLED